MKRSIRQNIYGNWVGYIGRVRSQDFGGDGHAEKLAKYWLKTGIVDGYACYE